MSAIEKLAAMLDAVVSQQYNTPAEAAVVASEALELAGSLLAGTTLTPAERRVVQSERITALLAMAQFVYGSGNVLQADAYRDEALREARVLDDPRTIAKCLLQAGSIHIVKGQHGAARLELEEALQIFIRLEYHDGHILVQYNLAMLASREDRLSDAMAMYTEARTLAETYGQQHIVLGCHVSIGMMYEQLGEYERALEQYKLAVELSRSLGDRTMLANALSNTSTAMYNAGHIEESLRFLREAKATLIENDNLFGLCTVMNNEGATLLSLDRFDESIRSYGEAIQYCERMDNQRERLAAHSGRAIVWLRMGNHQRAVQDAEAAVGIARTFPDSPALLMKALCTALEVYLEAGDVDHAETTANEALAVDERMETRSMTIGLLHLATQVMERKQRYKKALALHRRMHEMYVRLHQQEATRRMQLYAADVRLSVAERDREILRLQNARLREEIDVKLRELTAMTLTLAERGVESTSRTGSVVWQVFNEQFSALNSPFTERLARRCPSLTATEMRVCALMKIGLGTKEAAQLLHVTDRAVEKHRYNIRRKLGLDNTVNLATWLEMMVVQG